jgi:hypothetical protein
MFLYCLYKTQTSVSHLLASLKTSAEKVTNKQFHLRCPSTSSAHLTPSHQNHFADTQQRQPEPQSDPEHRCFVRAHTGPSQKKTARACMGPHTQRPGRVWALAAAHAIFHSSSQTRKYCDSVKSRGQQNSTRVSAQPPHLPSLKTHSNQRPTGRAFTECERALRWNDEHLKQKIAHMVTCVYG